MSLAAQIIAKAFSVRNLELPLWSAIHKRYWGIHFKSLQNPHIEGLTILGGEPFEPFNQAELVNLLHIVKQEFSEKNIWCFTGFVYDKDLLKGQRKHTNATDEMLSYIMNKTAQKAVLFLCLLKKEKNACRQFFSFI